MVPKVPVFKCTPPPHVWTSRVNKSTTMLTKCMWTTVPQNVYYRLKAWKAVSTLLKASNQFLGVDFQQRPVHHLASGQHWSQMQNPLGKGGIQENWQHSVLQFQKHPGPRRELNFQQSPPMHKCQQEMKSLKIIWTKQTGTINETEEERTRTSRRMKQEETQQQSKSLKVKF